MTRREGGQEVCTGRLLCEHLSGSAHDPVFPGTTEGINSLVPGPWSPYENVTLPESFLFT